MMRRDNGEEPDNVVVLCEEARTKGTFADEVLFPHALTAGATVSDGCVLHPVDIPAALAQLGYEDPLHGLADPRVSFFVRVVADVQGTPFDPKAEFPVTVHG